MSSTGFTRRMLKVLAVPVIPVAFAVFASPALAQTAAQEAKTAANKTGNAITDSWITMKVHSQFVPDDALEGSDIDVDTKNGVVTLNGTVASAAGRTRAVAIAKATDGVSNVVDRLRVGAAVADASASAANAGRKAGEEAKDVAGTTGRAVTDGWIKSKIYAQYITEGALDDSDLDIDITKGAVTLNGVVRTEAGRTKAQDIAKATDGVKSVTNNLKVTPKAR
jgi:hyperosmotically inducible periplasmic protein